MKTTFGGDRLGSGQKQEISLKHYNRSTHDMSSLWRSSMAAGTLVPFMSELALPGDSWDIDLNCEVLTLPTIGPLFGSYKVQLDVFEIPMRLYNAALQMNKLKIGMDMSAVKLPQLKIQTNNHANYVQTFDDNEQINSSCIFKYLGISGLGLISGATNPAYRYFNAIPYLAYWDIYKNYYANKQEERGYVIHTGAGAAANFYEVCNLYNDNVYVDDILDNPVANTGTELTNMVIELLNDLEPNLDEMIITINGNDYTLNQAFASVIWNEQNKTVICQTYKNVEAGNVTWGITDANIPIIGGVGAQLALTEFTLDNIDDMKETILQHPFQNGAFIVDINAVEPYSLALENLGEAGADLTYSCQYTQEGLGLKTYQSDLFNNWIDTEWIDGINGINAVTAVSTTGDSFTIDALNLAQKVYDMLNRIAASGGTYDNWLDAVYSHQRVKAVSSPVYHGSLIKELSFEEVISNADTETASGGTQPLGTLAGRGRLTQKHKGGKMIIKVDEPSYIMGIVSLTPRIDYSQGNSWDMNLKTYDDFHKPALDGIGFQDLITEQMSWTDSTLNSADGSVTFKSAGKQPAWINYMTNVNKVYGNFAVETKDMFMTLNRRYDKSATSGAITDLTTYIDPSKFNHIFAQTELDAQNFWVQISKNITARRKMSGKIIPNI